MSLFQWIMHASVEFGLKYHRVHAQNLHGKGYFAFEKLASAFKNVISILNSNLTLEN